MAIKRNVGDKTCSTCEYWVNRSRGTEDGFIGGEVDCEGECMFHPPIMRTGFTSRLETHWNDCCGNYKQEPDDWAKSEHEIAEDTKTILSASNETALKAYNWFKEKGIKL